MWLKAAVSGMITFLLHSFHKLRIRRRRAAEGRPISDWALHLPFGSHNFHSLGYLSCCEFRKWLDNQLCRRVQIIDQTKVYSTSWPAVGMNFRIDRCIMFGMFFDDFHVFWDIDFSIDVWSTFLEKCAGSVWGVFWGRQKSILAPKRIFGSLLAALWLHFDSFWLPLAPFWWPLAPFWFLVG